MKFHNNLAKSREKYKVHKTAKYNNNTITRKRTTEEDVVIETAIFLLLEMPLFLV